jgi:hypothetical protein
LSWPKEPEATKPFGNRFDKLTVLSQTLSVIEGSKGEGPKAPRKIEGRIPSLGALRSSALCSKLFALCFFYKRRGFFRPQPSM